MDNERKFKGIWIPKEIWEEKSLSILEKVILVEIDSFEECYASNNYFAKFFGLSAGRISQIITNLKEKKYINVDYIYKGKEVEKRIITINTPPYPEVFNKLNRYLENENGVFNKLKGEYLENYKENNINISNNIKNNIKEKIYKKEKYGEYGRVKLTNEEYQKLIKEFGKDFIDKQIMLLDEYVESNNNKNKYTNFNLVIRKSIREKWFKQQGEKDTPEWFDKEIKEEELTDEEKEFNRKYFGIN